MAILVPRWLDASWQVRLQMCSKILYGESRKLYEGPNQQYDFPLELILDNAGVS